MLILFPQQNEGRAIPKEIEDKIEEQQRNCRPCQENAELPRVPKVNFPAMATPNLAVSLDVMIHTVRSASVDFLISMDAGDLFLKLAHLSDDTARTAFNAYLYRWIATFAASTFTTVGRDSNLTNQMIPNQLRLLESQLCPIPREAPWSLGSNERSHRFIHKAIEKLLFIPNFDCGKLYERLMSEVEMSWNFTKHAGRTLSHFNCFGVIPRVLGEPTGSPAIRERISLIEMARTETEKNHAEAIINKVLHSSRRHALSLHTFTIGQSVWFYRRRLGWRKCIVAKMTRPTIFVSFESRLYPTLENRARPFFGPLSMPPEIRGQDSDQRIFSEEMGSSQTC